jgi:hypothetical protein
LKLKLHLDFTKNIRFLTKSCSFLKSSSFPRSNKVASGLQNIVSLVVYFRLVRDKCEFDVRDSADVDV